MSAKTNETTANANAQAQVALAAGAEAASGVPKKITNAQTVCNEKNEKGKLCNGHLKQVRTGGEQAEQHLRGDDVLFKCQFCGTLYMGPPLGHIRDPYKQQRFVENELTAILQAAGGTLPAIVQNEKGAYVLAESQAAAHGHAPAKPDAAAKPSPAAATGQKATPSAAAKGAGPSASASAPATAAPSASAQTPAARKPAGEAKTAKGYVPPPAPGPVPGETPEQKLARLRAIVAEAKRRKAAAEEGGDEASETAETAHAAEPGAASSSSSSSAATVARTQPSEADTSGLDSSAQADEHRPAAEAQAATGMASAVPLSPAAANASPAALEEHATHGTPGRAAFDTGPVPGETQEQKIARLRLVVNAARERAGKPPKY